MRRAVRSLSGELNRRNVEALREIVKRTRPYRATPGRASNTGSRTGTPLIGEPSSNHDLGAEVSAMWIAVVTARRPECRDDRLSRPDAA